MSDDKHKDDAIVVVGDLDSKVMGSGARSNEGKPDYSLIYSPDIKPVLKEDTPPEIYSLLDHLGKFQLSGRYEDIVDAYHYALNASGYNQPTTTHMYGTLDTTVAVFAFGVKKYKAFNWMKGMPWSVCVGCIHRHVIQQYHLGLFLDKESGQPHIAHAICNIMMLMFYTKNYQQGNDLPCSAVDFK